MINDEGRVILVRHNYGAPMWLLPGGGVKRGESFRQCALREVNEELGVRLRPDGEVTLLGVYLLNRGNWRDYIALYVITGWDIEGEKSWEIERCGAFAIDALPDTASPAVRRRIAEWQGKQAVSDCW